ncbi:MAG TPA: DUF1549 domain-containing protein, partial [Planctomycetaceae bacterium]|nr:DUF1549 domain-containing protein [Planctomycetaceae bacterium]
TQIKPLLAQRCAACHGSLKQEAGLRLDASQLIRQGSDSGPIAVAAKPDQSLIFKRITADPDSRMPPEGEGTPLTAQEIALLKAWIEQGLPAPEREDYLADPRDFWSYQPVVKPELPTIKRKDWTTNPIDRFIAARHEQLGLSPQPQADRMTQLRRVYLDLIGLPPRRDELHAFLSDESPDAYERVVDRLLASPQYGERWGRHWMDVWRYSDWYGSRGINEIRYSQRHIWRWRDWIVDSLNADKGYDRMIVEMLAGDELAPADSEVLPATGFLGRNWYKFDRNVWMREMVEHTAMGFLSMSLKCARCHDHKFDPISQKEYYRFRAFFEPHDFRTDRISAETGEEKDATLGMVLKDGIARVYDKQPDVPTYLFQRGDDRYPDTEHPLTPGVIDVLGHTELEIQPIDLPLESFFPALQPELVAESEQLAERKIEQAKQTVLDIDQQIATLEKKIETFDSQPEKTESESSTENVFLHDDFSRPRPDVWKPLGGDWQYRDGKLIESQVGTFLTNVTQQQHPQNFQARVRYKHLPEGAIHSVGVAFDVIDRASWQAIYTYSSNGNSGIQAFHRDNGQEAYPASGIVPTPVEIGQELTVDLAVRDRDLNVWLNGDLKIVYKLPLERRDGTFALWTHSGTAEFDELRIESLPETFQLATSKEDNRKSPFHAITHEDLKQQLAAAMKTRQIAEQRIVIAQAERDSLFSRIAAERARISEAGNFEELARQASVAEKTAKLKQAESGLFALESQPFPDEKKLAAAKTALDQAKQALSKDDTEYTKLGEMYPRQSTGRRLALA